MSVRNPGGLSGCQGLAQAGGRGLDQKLSGGHTGMAWRVFCLGEDSWAVRQPGLSPGGIRAWPG